ncbi:MAG: hypothetical protein ACRCVJ_15360 [Clostridium sp.]|uniref:hypothetical protein n=1 Tax=Clostridium sp. TaxID=1506 RepID=UPI003F35DF48
MLNKLPNCNDNIFLYNYTGLKHIQFLESFKGQKALPLNLVNVPRKKVFVSIIINEKYISFSRIISKGILYQPISFSILSKKLNYNSKVIGFTDRYSPAIARRLNKYLMNLKDCSDLKKLNLKDLLYTFSSQLKLWFGLFKGVATKYLDAYLDWFVHVFENSFENKVMTSKIINAIFCS